MSYIGLAGIQKCNPALIISNFGTTICSGHVVIHECMRHSLTLAQQFLKTFKTQHHYCNSLYYNLPKSQLNRLQLIQKSQNKWKHWIHTSFFYKGIWHCKQITKQRKMKEKCFYFSPWYSCSSGMFHQTNSITIMNPMNKSPRLQISSEFLCLYEVFAKSYNTKKTVMNVVT